jgi:cation diffusion facilitator CzcD-associated flavoprotein CzcO
MSGPAAENVYDVIVIGAGPVGYTQAARVRAAAVPCFPSVSEVWLRLLEAYGA